MPRVLPLLLALIAATPLGLRAQTLQVVDFETGDLTQVFREVQGDNASVAVTTEVARAGSHALKAVLTTSDRRAEINNRYQRGALGGEHWYGWSIQFPKDQPTDGRFDIFTQFHDYHKEQPAWAKASRAPTSFLLREGGRMSMDLKFQSAPETLGHKTFQLGLATTGKWIDFVMHVKWTHQPDGFLKLWVDGQLLVDHTGPTYMDYRSANAGPYFKAGNYKGAKNWPGTSPRIVYLDEFRMGGADASFDLVNPATAAAARPPAPAPAPAEPAAAPAPEPAPAPAPAAP